MPELPEVEVTRQSFADRIAGARVLALHMGKPLRWPVGLAPDALVGRSVLGVRRRGKYLLIDLDGGLLLVHLGMSGSLIASSRAVSVRWSGRLQSTHLRPKNFSVIWAWSLWATILM